MIYLDNNATTPIDFLVEEAMHQIYALGPLNPSSIHRQGKKGKEILLSSRDKIAAIFQVHPSELYFTSSSTESLSTIILGHVRAKNVKRILSTKIEHNAVDACLKFLINQGVQVDTIPVGLKGAPTLESLEKALDPKVELVILSSVYSETGAMLDLKQISEFLYQRKIPLIVDATAHIGKAPFTVYKGMSAFSLSAHKFHGPQGAGLLFSRKNFPFLPLLLGGHQEMQHRAGTENLAAIVGLTKALELIEPSHFVYMEDLKNTLLRELLPFGVLNGTDQIISNTFNIAFDAHDAESLMIRLDQKGVLASMGSACSSGSIEPSRVLLEMGLQRNRARSSLRFSVSRKNTLDEMQKAAQLIKEELCGCAL